MISTQRRLRLCRALLVCNLAFIWGNSLLPGSVSGAFSDLVGRLLRLLFLQEGPELSGGGLLRKLAHFTEFAALGMTLGWLFAMRGTKKVRVPLLWGLAAACVDETIQLFVPNRGPGLRDVAIDTCGVAVGIGLLHLGHHVLSRRRKPSNLEDHS